MSYLIASSATRAHALRDRDRADHTGRTGGAGGADGGRPPEPSRLWTLIEALAYAGAFIDPSGILAVERLRQAKEEEARHDRQPVPGRMPGLRSVDRLSRRARTGRRRRGRRP